MIILRDDGLELCIKIVDVYDPDRAEVEGIAIGAVTIRDAQRVLGFHNRVEENVKPVLVFTWPQQLARWKASTYCVSPTSVPLV